MILNGGFFPLHKKKTELSRKKAKPKTVRHTNETNL